MKPLSPNDHFQSEGNAAEESPAGTMDPVPGLDRFGEQFFKLFNRAGHRRLFSLYLRALVSLPAKTIEGMAGALAGSTEERGTLAQSLQHFISTSPWDEGLLLSAWARRARETIFSGVGPVILTLAEIDIPKKGSQSVGVQRQLARSSNRKLNCQVAVSVGLASASFHLPISVRLYLPGRWLADDSGAVERTVPEEHRRFVPKEEIATRLVDEWLPLALPVAGIAAEQSLAPPGGALESHVSGLGVPIAVPESSRISGSADGLSLVVARRALELARKSHQVLREEYGLCQFEGRSWRGWHHHAAITCLAFGFGLWSRPATVPGTR